jgi:predicted  nucleic acid-binding Zn-ribbon protein
MEISNDMSVNCIAPHNIQIDNKLQRSCLAASSRWVEELSKAKATKKLTALQERKNEIKEEIKVVRHQLLNLDPYIEKLEKQSYESFRKAGAEKDLAAMKQLLEEGNDAREVIEKKKKTKLELENVIKTLELELPWLKQH